MKANSAKPARRTAAGHNNPHAPAARLVALALRVGKLSIDRSDPHRFFEERSELEHELLALARDI